MTLDFSTPIMYTDRPGSMSAVDWIKKAKTVGVGAFAILRGNILKETNEKTWKELAKLAQEAEIKVGFVSRYKPSVDTLNMSTTLAMTEKIRGQWDWDFHIAELDPANWPEDQWEFAQVLAEELVEMDDLVWGYWSPQDLHFEIADQLERTAAFEAHMAADVPLSIHLNVDEEPMFDVPMYTMHNIHMLGVATQDEESESVNLPVNQGEPFRHFIAKAGRKLRWFSHNPDGEFELAGGYNAAYKKGDLVTITGAKRANNQIVWLSTSDNKVIRYDESDNQLLHFQEWVPTL